MEVKRNFLPMDNWLYLRIFTGRVFCDQLIGDILKPVIHQYNQNHKEPLWFFIRYNNPRHHLRLRFKTQDSIQLLHSINQLLEPFVCQGTIWEVELATYKREVERYQQTNIEICEHIFSNESSLISSLLSQRLSHNQYTLLSIALTNLYIDILFENPENKLSFLSQNFKFFKEELKLDKTTLKGLNKKYSESFYELESFDFHTYEKEFPFISRFLYEQKKRIKELSNVNEIAGSLIHMFINRCFHSDPRMMEMTVYHHLEKSHRTIWSKRKNQVTT